MTKRYLMAKDPILEGCLVTPDVYKGILERFEKVVPMRTIQRVRECFAGV